MLSYDDRTIEEGGISNIDQQLKRLNILRGVAALFACCSIILYLCSESSSTLIREGDTLSEIAETHNTTGREWRKQPTIHLIYGTVRVGYPDGL